MGKAALTAVSLLAAMSLCATAEIRWIDRDYDFGLMKEIAGPKTGTSRFVNLGPDTVTIFSVRPSCGCTTADYSDAPIAPGDTAVVSYTYNPDMRPGKFDKSVKVRLSNGDRYSIRITGNVLGTPESLATLYPVDAGDIRLSDAVIQAGDVTFGRTRAFFVNAYSLPLDSISPVVVSGSQGLAVTPSRPKAGPGDIITYSVNFDSRRHGVYGPVEIPVTFRADAASEPATVTFHAFVLPDTEALTLHQKGKHPACDLTPDPIDLGMRHRSCAHRIDRDQQRLRSAPHTAALRAVRCRKFRQAAQGNKTGQVGTYKGRGRCRLTFRRSLPDSCGCDNRRSGPPASSDFSVG